MASETRVSLEGTSPSHREKRTSALLMESKRMLVSLRAVSVGH
jgi:hypothetical protein